MNVEQLKHIEIFSQVPGEILSEMMNLHQIYMKSYEKNRLIHEQGADCIHFDLVLSGKVAARSLNEKGEERTVFQFLAGDFIGANLLFGRQNAYPLALYCTEACSLLFVSKEAVSQLLHHHHFTICFIRSLSLNSQGMNRKIRMFTHKTLRENLVGYLRKLALEQKVSSIELPLSKKELADHLNVERQSLFRELKKMKDEGLIEVSNRSITLHF